MATYKITFNTDKGSQSVEVNSQTRSFMLAYQAFRNSPYAKTVGAKEVTQIQEVKKK